MEILLYENKNVDPLDRPQSRPVVITIITHVVRTYVRLSVRRQSLPAGTVGWPSGSLMTPILYTILLKTA